jgi:hypothetical protein
MLALRWLRCCKAKPSRLCLSYICLYAGGAIHSAAVEGVEAYRQPSVAGGLLLMYGSRWSPSFLLCRSLRSYSLRLEVR